MGKRSLLCLSIMLPARMRAMTSSPLASCVIVIPYSTKKHQLNISKPNSTSVPSTRIAFNFNRGAFCTFCIDYDRKWMTTQNKRNLYTDQRFTIRLADANHANGILASVCVIKYLRHRRLDWEDFGLVVVILCRTVIVRLEQSLQETKDCIAVKNKYSPAFDVNLKVWLEKNIAEFFHVCCLLH